jgi:hypothetical protein
MSRKIAPLEIGLVIALFALTNLVSAFRQKQNTFDEGLAWERPYYTMAGQFARHEPVATIAPYVYRVGTPFVVSLLSPGDLVRGFRIVNTTGSFIASILLLFWLQGYVKDWRTRVLLVTLFLIQWDAPPRYMYHSPVHVDAWYFVFALVGLLAIRRYQEHPSLPLLGGLIALSFVGTLFREIVMIVPITFLAAHQPFSLVGPPGECDLKLRMPPLSHWLPFLSGAAAFAILHRFVHQTDSYSFIATILDFLYGKGEDPNITSKALIGYVQAWFLAFGPVLFIILYDWRKTCAFLGEHQTFSFFLATGAWLGFFGGTDTERLLYWSMPGVYVLLGVAIEGHRAVLSRWPVALTFVLGQMMTSRILWTTPDYPTNYPHTFPVLQQFGSHVQFLDLFSYHGFRQKELLSIVEFTIYGVAILWTMRRLERRQRRSALAMATEALPSPSAS